jgi:hypothetical protein
MEGAEPEGREEGNWESCWCLPPAPRICIAFTRYALLARSARHATPSWCKTADVPLPQYTMTVKHRRYRTPCAACNLRIRVGRKFVIDPIHPQKTYHLACYRQPKLK